MSPPLVTVLMPVFNSERFLHDAIQSVVEQTFSDFELLIFNDGSTDKSTQIIQSFKDSRIRHFFSTKNIGYVRQLNKGLAMASGTYIARMDSDDIALPQRFEEQIRVLKNEPKQAMVGSWAETIDEFGRHLGFAYPPSEDSLIKLSITHFINPFIHSSVFVKKATLEKHSLQYDFSLSFSEDLDLWEKLSEHSLLGNLPKVLIKYRQHWGSVTASHSHRQKIQTVQIAHRALERSLSRKFPVELLFPLKIGFFSNLRDALRARSLFEDNLRILKRALPCGISKESIEIASSRNLLEVLGRRLFHPYFWPFLFYSFRLAPMHTIDFFRHHSRKKLITFARRG